MSTPHTSSFDNLRSVEPNAVQTGKQPAPQSDGSEAFWPQSHLRSCVAQDVLTLRGSQQVQSVISGILEWFQSDMQLLTPKYNALHAYCTCMHLGVCVCVCVCVCVWLHDCFSVFCVFWFCQRLIDGKQFLFYLIYLWFPLSEILISAINQPEATEGKRNPHTHDAKKKERKCVCACLSEFPSVCSP